VDESDELASLEVYNTVWPRDAVTIDAVHSYRDSAQDYIDYLAREDGVVLGSGVGAIFAYRPHRVDTLITVLAGKRRRGAGTALFEAISKWASERRAHELEVSVSGDDPESLSYGPRQRLYRTPHQQRGEERTDPAAERSPRLPTPSRANPPGRPLIGEPSRGGLTSEAAFSRLFGRRLALPVFLTGAGSLRGGAGSSSVPRQHWMRASVIPD
jgi:GNAT superfamily N-acetyltransferase